MSPRGTRISINILFIAVILSIGLNAYLLFKLVQFQQQATELIQIVGPTLKETISQTNADLADLRESTVEFQARINYDLPLEVEIPFSEEISVPVETNVPIQQDIDTTVTMVIGGVELPMDLTVPVDVEVPLNLDIPVVIDQMVPLSTTIPLDLEVPVAIEIQDTALAENIDQLREVLSSLERSVDQALRQTGN
ncbi:MAG TPA: hypothetical protein PKE64_03120 [Anaerolineae bacterium]|nr:hypothetical protein [Anaerolineae bacterium]HMR62980.1 hypothetical protein [Anaerolineae bacterium]